MRRVIAGVLAASTLPLLWVAMWIVPDIAFGLFFVMLIAPWAVWQGIMEGHNVES
jgi:hypothetical protein